ncbi:hypothetical protein VCHA37P191_120141 [Vibrio chagasii]|nr:hypothetical protein VCHA37P191_120141 [Vibrio chagasii]CAH6961108.1 hypothetical protein VCHA49P380_130141 [Vibrio chagasii]
MILFFKKNITEWYTVYAKRLTPLHLFTFKHNFMIFFDFSTHSP